MSWLWLAHVETLPAGTPPLAAAEVRDVDGSPAGVLAAWLPERRPRVPAAKVDARLIDPNGAPALASLVLAPRAVRLPFDDGAVQGARRALLAAEPSRGFSTLVRGDSIFAGALTVADPGHGRRLRDDPFARIFPQRLLQVAGGLLGRTPAPAGPVIERYGGGNPWPHDRFD